MVLIKAGFWIFHRSKMLIPRTDALKAHVFICKVLAALRLPVKSLVQNYFITKNRCVGGESDLLGRLIFGAAAGMS